MADDQPTAPLSSRQTMTPGLPRGPDNIKDYLVSRGWSEDQAERAAQKAAAQMASAPQDWTGMAGFGLELAIPFLVARYIPGGGGLIRTAKQILTNVSGQTMIGGATRAIQSGEPSQFLSGAIQSGLKAGPGAVAQGALGMALLPRAATVRSQRAIEKFQKGLSPEVGRVLDPAKPKDLYSAGTVDRMMSIAGKKLDAMEAAVQKGLGDTRLSIPPTSARVSEPAAPLFGPSGTRIKDPALQKLLSGAQKGSQASPASEGSTFTEVRDRIKALRTGAYETPRAQIASKRKANQLEEQMLSEIRQKGFGELADQYQQALLTHAKDMVGVRGIKWVQAQQRRPGGANPVDDPELSQAMDHLASKGRAQEARLALAAAFAAMRHPFLAAGEAIQAAKQAGKVVDVNRIKGPLAATPIRQVVPPVAGSAMRLLWGPQSQTQPVNPALDELTQAEQDLGESDTHLGDLDRLIEGLP